MPSFRANVGHPPFIHVKRANPVTLVGQDVGLTQSAGSSGYEFPFATAPSSFPLTAVPTFHNIGLYWDEPGVNVAANLAPASDSHSALVRFRKQGTNTWRKGHPMLWDDRVQGNNIGDTEGTPTVALAIPYGFKQHRSSIVEVESNTIYEVEVATSVSHKLASVTVTTWNEVFPEGVVTELPATSSSHLAITASGMPNAYRVYKPGPTGSAIINRNHGGNNCITVSGAYIIIRGLTLRESNDACIGLAPSCHHVVIEDCDGSEMGHADTMNPNPDGGFFACNSSGLVGTTQSGMSVNLGITNIVIQNCRIHDPAFDSNAWGEPPRVLSPCGPGSNHPAGVTAIYLTNPGGQIVIRYNEIQGNFAKMFDDGIGGASNFSWLGNVHRDSDVYGNRFSMGWDDMCECEGANMNVRVYGNYAEYALVPMGSFGSTSIGPLYVFRNVATRGVKTPNSSIGEGQAFKSYGKTLSGSSGPVSTMTFGGGRVYLYHNTTYKSATALNGNGMISGPINGDQLGITTSTARNNIWDTKNSISSNHVSILNTAPAVPGASWDFDVVGAGHTSWQSIEPNCLVADPVYEPAHASGQFTPATSSPAHGAAQPIPNFNDVFFGAGPDIGAQERGATALQYGNR